MRIIKTSEQHKKEEKRKQNALSEMWACPECGKHNSMLNIEEMQGCYYSKCKNCGCEWVSEYYIDFEIG